ncbi:exodeoxyribonuclease VII large subunit [Salinicola rhizosphaerae]|uniref:Exodeoxyribonuclease 7 large subunit n=1 Tax=Salinicola rhizosphaerae TaxID=1443141 RepID=A0ABQ3E201_9GAMM|nr:exodeoxyribonuclease VII large subunit [Salinicola rhizosphaerae]GHB20898.1 exodeoxyribonuclease 7 large subunit [Salinicola rhizosphaerae]
MPSPMPQAISVSDLNRQARQMLERGFGDCWVEGEISGLARPASGHIYFTLKDAKAQLRCAFFRNRAGLSRVPLKDGDRIKVRGRVSIFEPRGDYQLIVDAVQPSGEGELMAAYERLKRQLETEGVFANARELPYPPRHLALITSPTGAAIRDALAVLAARWPMVRVSVFPTPVQGRDASPAMIRALALVNRQARRDAEAQKEAKDLAIEPFDAILITRGGGSLEDLWAFNDEHLARAIFHSGLPVMAAVGHETDFTLAEFAADVRAPTPSAAAERLVPDRRDLEATLAQQRRRLSRALQNRLDGESQRLDHLRARLRHPGERLARQRQDLSSLERRLRLAMSQHLKSDRQQLDATARRLSLHDPSRTLSQSREQVDRLHQRLEAAQQSRLRQARQRLESAARELNAVSPLAVLGRGYSILQDDSGQIVRAASQTQPGQTLTARLGEGRLKLEVKRRLKR